MAKLVTDFLTVLQTSQQDKNSSTAFVAEFLAVPGCSTLEVWCCEKMSVCERILRALMDVDVGRAIELQRADTEKGYPPKKGYLPTEHLSSTFV